MSDSRERIILSALIKNNTFSSAAIPFLKNDYFADYNERLVFEVLMNYHLKYNVMPNKTALMYESLNTRPLNDSQQEQVTSIVNDIFETSVDAKTDKWLLDTAEKFCQERAAFNVISTAIEVYNGEEKGIPEAAIPDMLREAVNISFNSSIGHDWLDDASKRFDFYNDPVACIPFELQSLNEIVGGGIPRKTLNVVMAGVNCGKTGFLCSLAASYSKLGFNVLYVTMEMREELISKRIDANLLNVAMDDLASIGKDRFMDKVEQIKQKSYGKIIVKEFAPGAAHAGHINHVIKELNHRRKVKVDVIIVDYIGICASSRVGLNGVNSYTYLKSVSEELRALAVEHDAVCWSAVQLNRSGFGSSDVEMTDVADAFSIPATADFMLSLMRTEELDKMNQVLLKQIKSRYGNKTDKLRFVLGVDQAKQQYYDVEQDLTPNQAKQHHNVEQSFRTKGKSEDRLTGLS